MVKLARIVRTVKKYKRDKLASKVAKLSKQIKQRTPETKWSISTANASYNYAGDISQPLTGISQGTGDFGNRIGDQIRLKGMRLKMAFNMSATTGGQTNRVIVFQYIGNPDGAIGVASYINLLLHSADLSTARATLAPYDHDNRSNFRVLYDKVFHMNYSSSPGTSASNNTETKYLDVKINIPEKGRVVEYFAAGTTVTKNEVCILVLSDKFASQNYVYDCATYYTDA